MGEFAKLNAHIKHGLKGMNAEYVIGIAQSVLGI